MRFSILNITSIVAKNKFISIMLLVAAFLRLYKLAEYTTFLSDQGRDAIIVKRIITFEHLTLIGPPTSIGQIFMGPFYYYLVAPGLWLFHFNPVGMSYEVAILSLIGILLSYWVLKKEFNTIVAVLFSAFIVFSQVNVEFARFSWNPNLLPVFAFFTIYFFYKYMQTNKIGWGLAAGAFFSLCLQLHYLAILMSLGLLYYFIRTFKKNIAQKVIQIGVLFVGFCITYSPLILFDLKHNFINTKSFISLFTSHDLTAQSSLWSRFMETQTAFFQHVSSLPLPANLSLLIFALFVAGYIVLRIKHKRMPAFIDLNYVNVILYILSFSMLNSQRHPHYYGAIYYSFFLVVSYLLYLLYQKKMYWKWIAIGLVTIYILINIRTYTFIIHDGSNQIQYAQQMAQSIIEKNPQQPYHVVGLPFYETELHVKYFLEVAGHAPLDADSTVEPKEIYVVCHEKPGCEVLGNAQWQLAAFKNGKIDSQWPVGREIIIYKVVHAK